MRVKSAHKWDLPSLGLALAFMPKVDIFLVGRGSRGSFEIIHVREYPLFLKRFGYHRPA